MLALLYGGSPGDYQSESELTILAWLENWPEAMARKTMMTPPPESTPEGIHSFILNLTGDKDLADEAELNMKVNIIARKVEADFARRNG